LGDVTGALSLSNVTVTGGLISGSSYLGGLVGYAGGAITSTNAIVTSQGSLIGTGGFVGGFYGYVNSGLSLTGISYVGGLISATSYVGGLVGYSVGSITLVNDYTSLSTLAGSGNNISGLIGFLTGGLYGSSITYLGALVTSGTTTYLGGITNYVNGGVTLLNAYASIPTLMASGGYVGGLLGDVIGPLLISGSSFVGSLISGSKYVGGLVGYSDVSIINSYVSVGTLLGTSYVGGFIGYAGVNATLIGVTYNGLLISGVYALGGLIGGSPVSSSVLSIANAYVSVPSLYGSGGYVGGLLGLSAGSLTLSSVTFAGSMISGSSYLGGLIGYEGSSLITSGAVGLGISSVLGTGAILAVFMAMSIVM
jgi:hypothetical protein